MPHKKRKVRKQRGSRTYGYGRVGQHRGGGQRGGHGKAGLHKHKWSYVLRCEPDYFEKRGFNSPRGNEANTINVGELPEQVDQLLEEKKAVKRRDGIYIGLAQLGYDKLLGSGRASRPLFIKVASHSGAALEKMKIGGGKILEVEQQKSSLAT